MKYKLKKYTNVKQMKIWIRRISEKLPDKPGNNWEKLKSSPGATLERKNTNNRKETDWNHQKNMKNSGKLSTRSMTTDKCGNSERKRISQMAKRSGKVRKPEMVKNEVKGERHIKSTRLKQKCLRHKKEKMYQPVKTGHPPHPQGVGATG